MSSVRTLFLAVATLILTISLVSVDKAYAVDAPELFQSSVTCYRSIVQDDDLFCLNRYQLPTSDTTTPVSAEAWCQYLTDQTGCVGNPVDPDQPWSLTPGAAYVTIYDTSVLQGQVQVPRIGYSLAGVYFAAGHGITWGDTNVEGCVESSVTIFTVPASNCLPVTWNTEDNTAAAQRSQLASDLKAQLVNLELVDPLVARNELVVNNKITPTGLVISLETLNVIDRLLPGTFQTESLPVIDAGFTPGAGMQLQSDIDATAAAFKSNLADAGTELGIPGDALGLLLFTVIGIVAFWAVKRFTDGNNTPLAVVAFLTVMLAGVPVGAVPVAVAAVTGVILVALAALFIVRRMVFAS